MTHAATDPPRPGCWGRTYSRNAGRASGVCISEKFDDAMDTMSDSAKKELVEALTAVVKERRLCAQLLSKPYERGTYEATMARFVELQTTIEALERALVSEADFP
jgi:hypothetical protein